VVIIEEIVLVVISVTFSVLLENKEAVDGANVVLINSGDNFSTVFVVVSGLVCVEVE